MPAQSEFGDAATMIDGPAGSYGYTSTSYVHAQAHAASGRAKGAESANARGTVSTFARTPDYFSEERPFVVHIGKKGVLGALEELDQHLRTVRSRSHTVLSMGKLTSGRRQGGYNKILSDKV
jgi:hypothetical protein